MVLIKVKELNQIGMVAKLCLFFLALSMELGRTDGKDYMEQKSMTYSAEVNLLRDITTERVTYGGMVLDKTNKNRLFIALKKRDNIAKSGTGCIVTVPANNLQKKPEPVAGRCHGPPIDLGDLTEIELQRLFRDGPTLTSDPGDIRGNMVEPQLLQSLSNGDILFIDAHRCVRRVRNGYLTTIFGSCVLPTKDNFDPYYALTGHVMGFLYIEERDMMVFSMRAQGVVVAFGGRNARLILNVTDVYSSKAMENEPDAYGLAQGPGNIIWHKVKFGYNKYDLTDIHEFTGMLVHGVNFWRIISFSSQSSNLDQTAKVKWVDVVPIKDGYLGMATNPLEPHIVVVSEVTSYPKTNVHTVNLMDDIQSTRRRESACRIGKVGGTKIAGTGALVRHCQLPYEVVSPIWLNDQLVLAFANGHNRFLHVTYDIETRPCHSPRCMNGGTCVVEGKTWKCQCPTLYKGKTCDQEIEECQADTCNGNGVCEEKLGPGTICKCNHGYTGTGCANNDDCQFNPCRNGGTCTDQLLSFSCKCTSEWIGRFCHIDKLSCPTTRTTDSCFNGGVCKEIIGGGFKCFCKPGFGNANCALNINDCDPNPCANGGTCRDKVNGFVCSCPPAWTGKLCHDDVTECLPATCSRNGECKEKIGGGTHCLCNPGWTGSNCGKRIDYCDPNPCGNGAECTKLLEGYSCSCTTGFQGQVCDEDIPECTADTCAVPGACREVDGGGTVCIKCPVDLTGLQCQKEVDDCESNPCAKGATCEDGIATFTCLCPSHSQGITCSEDVPECQPDTCAHGQCREKYEGGVICICDEGYTGDDCGTYMHDCLFLPCHNGGTCQESESGFSCVCPSAFTGEYCANDVIDCDCNSCNQHGKCKERVGGGIFCKCQEGWTGDTCNIDVNDCKPNPCANKGVCLDRVADYECVCPAGFTGKRCNEDIPECEDKSCRTEEECYEKSGGGVFCVPHKKPRK